MERRGAEAWLVGGKAAEHAARLAWRDERRRALRRSTTTFAVERAQRRILRQLSGQRGCLGEGGGRARPFCGATQPDAVTGSFYSLLLHFRSLLTTHIARCLPACCCCLIYFLFVRTTGSCLTQQRARNNAAYLRQSALGQRKAAIRYLPKHINIYGQPVCNFSLLCCLIMPHRPPAVRRAAVMGDAAVGGPDAAGHSPGAGGTHHGRCAAYNSTARRAGRAAHRSVLSAKAGDA